jgi:hypothetical protein
MTAIVIGLLTQFWPYIVAAIAALAWGWKQRSAGAAKERARQAAADAKARDVADDVQNDVGAMTPEQRREALRKWAKS